MICTNQPGHECRWYSILFLALALGSLLSVGCSSEVVDGDDDTPTQTANETTGTETVTPTPVPQTAEELVWQVFSKLQIAPESTGLDLDEDGQVDNGLPAAFVVLADGLVEEMNAQIADQGPGGACEQAAEGCPLSTAQVEATQAATEQLIRAIVSVEAINLAIAVPFEAGFRPYGLEILDRHQGADELGLWSGGVAESGDWAPEMKMSTLIGQLDLTGGVSRFERGFMALTFTLFEQDGSPIVIDFPLYDVIMELQWNEARLDDDLMGAGVKVETLVDIAEKLIEVLIPPCGSVSCGGPPDVRAILSALETKLVEEVSDITCDYLDPCISSAFIYSTEAVFLDP